MFKTAVPTIRRCFSTSLSTAQLVKPPVQVHGIEGRYATALYSAGSKQKKLDALDKELQSLKELYAKDLKFREFVLNPTLDRKHKKEAIIATLKKLGQSELSQNFFGIVAENGRLNKLESIIKTFSTLMSADRGEVICEVTTAKELDNASLKEINAALQGFAKPGEKLQVTYKVNPALLGGMTVTIGDRFVDMTLLSKVNMYEKILKSANV